MNFRCKIHQIIYGNTLSVEASWFGWEGLCRRIPFTGHITCRYRQIFNRPDRLTGLAVEGIHKCLFCHLHDNFTAVGQISQNRGGRVIPVPDIMMNHLLVPATLTGLDVHGYQTAGKQVRTRPVTAVSVTCCGLYRQIGNAQLRVTRHGSPDTSVTGNFSTVTQPGFAAELTRLRDGLECPQMLTSACIVGADVTFNVVL